MYYPTISEWLKSLDEHGERGLDKLDYAQYTVVLEGLGFVRLNDLLGAKTTEKLQELTQSQINWGTANRLMTFAKADEKKLVRDAKKKKARKDW